MRTEKKEPNILNIIIPSQTITATNNPDIALTIASDGDDDEESMKICEIIVICRVDNGDNLGSNLNFYYFITCTCSGTHLF